MNGILLSPPVAFVVVLIAMMLFARLLSTISAKPKTHGEGEGKSYACGEDVPTNMMQPDYSQFFPFAFFFTILHVVALVIATVPTETIETFVMAALYVGGAVIGLMILLRK